MNIIFDIAVGPKCDAVKEVYALSHVCRWWKYVAEHTPQLWTSYYLRWWKTFELGAKDATNVDHTKRTFTPEERAAHAEEWFKFSKNRPVELIVNCDHRIDLEECESENPFSDPLPLKSLLHLAGSRLESLGFYGPRFYWVKIATLCPEEFPILQRLAMRANIEYRRLENRFGCYKKAVTLFQNSPIEDATMLNMYSPYMFKTGQPTELMDWSRLTNIDYEDLVMTGDMVLDMFSACINLERALLSVTLWTDDGPIQRPDRPVSRYPNLKSLQMTLRGHLCSPLFASLELPSLEHLSLDGDVDLLPVNDSYAEALIDLFHRAPFYNLVKLELRRCPFELLPLLTLLELISPSVREVQIQRAGIPLIPLYQRLSLDHHRPILQNASELFFRDFEGEDAGMLGEAIINAINSRAWDPNDDREEGERGDTNSEEGEEEEWTDLKGKGKKKPKPTPVEEEGVKWGKKEVEVLEELSSLASLQTMKKRTRSRMIGTGIVMKQDMLGKFWYGSNVACDVKGALGSWVDVWETWGVHVYAVQ